MPILNYQNSSPGARHSGNRHHFRRWFFGFLSILHHSDRKWWPRSSIPDFQGPIFKIFMWFHGNLKIWCGIGCSECCQPSGHPLYVFERRSDSLDRQPHRFLKIMHYCCVFWAICVCWFGRSASHPISMHASSATSSQSKDLAGAWSGCMAGFGRIFRFSISQV